MEARQTQNTWPVVLLVSVIITATYLFMITRTTLWDRDEPRFARASVEMLETGNYLFPTFNGQLRAHKPILVYWLMSLSIRLFGNTEFACRFWSALGTAISCLLTFFIGKRLFGFREGLWSMVILASSVMMLAVGTMATADSSTLPFILAAMTAFTYAMTSKWYHYHTVLIGILMGLGMLDKGPIGLLPLPVMLITLWLARKEKDYIDFIKKSLTVSEALGIAIIIFLSWAIPANRATNGQFLSIFIGKHVITRMLHPLEHHGGNFLLYLPYYLPVIVGGFFPWIIVLPGAFSALAGNRLGMKPSKNLLLSWTISIVVIMSLAATKLPHYIIFIWPALALPSAAVIVAFQKGYLSKSDLRWLRRGNWFFVPVGLFAGVGLIVVPFFLQISGLLIPAAICGIILLLTTSLGANHLYHNRAVKAAKLAFVGVVAFYIPYIFGVLPVIESIKVAPAIAKAINQAAPFNTSVATYEFGEPSLNYYLGRNLQELSDQKEVVAWIQQQKEPAVLVIPISEYEEIKQNRGELPARVIFSKKGFNYSKGKTVELLALLCSREKN
jgi:4-amino-4-deoxy-L-arabinose transferase-like glycosyltransferase